MTVRMTEVPSWLVIALGELGVMERQGLRRDHPRILEYLASTSGPSTRDETPWCAAFVGWCLRAVGIDGTGRRLARSYMQWGREDLVHERPRLGAVTVLWRGSAAGTLGHVGFFVGRDAESVWLLGGNQANRVSVAPYPLRRVLGYRWPE